MENKPKDKNIKALTLLEVLVYLGVFGIIFFVMVQTVYYLQTANRRTTELLKLDRSIIFVTEHINDSIKSSFSIDPDIGSGGSSEFGVADGVLYVNQTSTYKQYSISSGRLAYDDNGTGTTLLTRSDNTLSVFSIEEIIDDAANIIGVQITITINSKVYTDISKTVTVSTLLD